MRIALTADPVIPVPPTLYGGIERIVAFLARGLVERGHQVTLFAHPASRVPVELVPYGVPPHRGLLARSRELVQVGSRLAAWRRRFDLVHSFGRLAALLPVLPLRGLPKVQSYQRPGVPWHSVSVAVRLAGPSLRFTGCSASLYRDRPRHDRYGGRWQTIYNGVELFRWQFVPYVGPDAPLAFLGRLEPIKGPQHAIAIARRAGRALRLAGNLPPDQTAWFEREIAPHLASGEVSWLGPVDDAAKNELLGGAAALLMPLEVDEAFGIVMAEAMACGTPVIGFARGALPEVVRDGRTGFVCRTVEQAAAAVARLDRIDREEVRADCEARFDSRAIVSAYERLYQEMLVR